METRPFAGESSQVRFLAIKGHDVPFNGQASIRLMPLSLPQKYAVHVANLRALDVACNHVYRQLKSSLARQENAPANALLKTFVLLLGAWAEVRFLKMLHESNAFTDAEREKILNLRSQLERWKAAVDIGFRRRYNVPAAPLSDKTLPRTAYHWFCDINTLIDEDLRPIIEIRNRLAHGQWARVLNTDLTEISKPMMMILNTENALSANFKMKIIDVISRLVNDLIVGGVAFERDFDGHYSLLSHTKTNLRTRKYDDWVASLRTKLVRGVDRRHHA